MRSKSRRWIGVDGEGVGRKPHRYVLLACSDGDYIQQRGGLSTIDCLEFLLDLGTRDARVCGYFLGYDWTKILQDLTRSVSGRMAIYTLFRPELRARPGGGFAYVTYKRYRLHWLATAMRIADDRGRKVTVWDLGKYYQMPFCKMEGGKLIGALVKWNVGVEVQARIAAMKDKRDRFTYRDIKKIREYCFQEVEALKELADKLYQAHVDADLLGTGWYGPGSPAGVLLNRHGIREQRGHLPPHLLAPVAIAFAGGRAEISRNGPIKGPIGGYDISSAYPYHATNLPCLVHGRWVKVTKEKEIKRKDVAHAIVYGHIRELGAVAWGPLPIRTKKGEIVFPRSGASGWWWRDEWLAARAGWSGLEFECAYVLKRECDCQPFKFIPDLFELRKQVGKETGAGILLKLTINSLYGKLAQTVGNPQFASRAWAGMITSGTRAQVLRLMLKHERLDSVLMIATDGLFSTEILPMSDKIVLGGWERTIYDQITLIRPGQYWVDQEKIRARGLGRENLDKQAQRTLVRAIAKGVAGVVLKDKVGFGGAKQWVNGVDVEHLRVYPPYGEWLASPSHVSLEAGPIKRNPDWSLRALCGEESHPYGGGNTAAINELEDIFEQLRELTY